MIREFIIEDKKDIEKIGKCFVNDFSALIDIENIKNHPFSKIYVYEENDIIKAFINFYLMYDKVEIFYIATKKEEQHKGYAYALLNSLINIWKKKGVYNVTLEVRKKNNQAINLYHKCGFCVIGIRNNYYGDDDALLLELKL